MLLNLTKPAAHKFFTVTRPRRRRLNETTSYDHVNLQLEGESKEKHKIFINRISAVDLLNSGKRKRPTKISSVVEEEARRGSMMGRNSKKKLAVEVIIKKYGWIGRGRGAVRTWLVHAFLHPDGWEYPCWDAVRLADHHAF